MSSVNPASRITRKAASPIKLQPQGGRSPRDFAKMTAPSIMPTCLPGYPATTATATIRDVIRSDLPSPVAFPLERVLLNAYYIEDLKYVNRRLSIPSGLFSPPTEVSTFDPRTQPTSSLPLLSYSRISSEHTTHGALRRPKSNLIDPKGEYVRSLRYRRPFRTGRLFSVRCVHHSCSEIVWFRLMPF